MNGLEAALHFGITRKACPTAGAIRDMFLATVLAGEDGPALRLRGCRQP